MQRTTAILGVALLLTFVPVLFAFSEGARIVEYTDNVYNYAFQYPSDWKLQKPPGPQPDDAGEVRVMVATPQKSRYVMAIVGQLGRSVTKRQFLDSPNRDAVVNALIELTVEQVYKKTSRQVGASSMMVGEKRPLPSDMGVMFYISTANFVGNTVMALAGRHVVPFDKDYMVTFMMVSPVDPKATAENETITRVFNSFHIVGEKPVPDAR